jgi:hypothetical protein
MRRLPTDLEILNVIYEDYHDEYASFDPKKPARLAKIYVPLDIPKIAAKLGTDEDIVFGRLFHHLDHKYGYEKDDGSHVHFFANAIGTEPRRNVHCIQFPYMASVLADLRHEQWKVRRTFTVAVASLILSILNIGFTAWKAVKDSPPATSRPATPIPSPAPPRAAL